jgi:hypothetical protein
VQNASWTATFSTQTNPQVINGSYVCEDSDPSTWSQNQQSGGKGMCIVYGVPAQETSAAASTAATSTTSTSTSASSASNCRQLASVSAASCEISFYAKVFAYVTPANAALRAMYPKAMEIVLKNDGPTTIEISRFEVRTYEGYALTECGPVCDTALPGHPALRWCYLEGTDALVCTPPEFPSTLGPGDSESLTILDHVGEVGQYEARDALAFVVFTWAPSKRYQITYTGTA